MAKLIKTVEYFKEKISKFYVLYTIGADEEIDVYNPMEEGLDIVKLTR